MKKSITGSTEGIRYPEWYLPSWDEEEEWERAEREEREEREAERERIHIEIEDKLHKKEEREENRRWFSLGRKKSKKDRD